MNGLTPRSRAYHYGSARIADHFIYRCYDADGVLLYVGCTNNVKRRMSMHLGNRANPQTASRWLKACMDRYEVEGPFDGREAGRNAEREAIRAEQPVFNIQERWHPYWMLIPDIAEYLISHGHFELAAETACSCWPEDLEDGAVSRICFPHNQIRRDMVTRAAA